MTTYESSLKSPDTSMEGKIKLDLFLGGKVSVYQPVTGYRSGVDAVLLASLVTINHNNDSALEPAHKKYKVLDLGCGASVASLCLANRIPNLDITGIDNNPIMHTLATKNHILNMALLNTMQSTFNVKLLDINQPYSVDEFINQFNIVICNPPYFKNTSHKDVSLYSSKEKGNMESTALLKDFINFAFKVLKNSGDLYMIYNSSRFHELLNLLNLAHWGGLEIYPIYSYMNQPATRCMIKIKKLSKSPTIFNAGIVMHQNDGSYTPVAENILKHGHCFFNQPK